MAQEQSSNKYFVPGYGISRAVIQSEICYHCGPDAIVRPYTLNGRDGFLITTPGQPLTQAQIDDLVESSRRYEAQLSARSGAQESDHFINRPVQVHHR